VKSTIIVLISFFSIFGCSVDDSKSLGKGGIQGGSGGDPRITMLRTAKAQASYWVNVVLSDDAFLDDLLSKEAEASVAKTFFNSKHKFADQTTPQEFLALDILKSQHVYVSTLDPKSEHAKLKSCAWTNDPTLPSLDHTRFFLPSCSDALKRDGQDYANHLLIHESFHHLLREKEFRKEFDIKNTEDEEKICDAVASFFQRAFAQYVKIGEPHWLDISPEHKLSERAHHTAVWSGRDMIIWGGCRAGEKTFYGCGGKEYFADGARYQPQTESWKPVATGPLAPSARAEHKALQMSDDRMFVWGGCSGGDGCTPTLGDGGLYDTKNDVWLEFPKAPIEGRKGHILVGAVDWAAVWGGFYDDGERYESLADGAIFESNEWRPVQPSPLKARLAHTAVAWEQKFLVWGGCSDISIEDCRGETFGDGAIYDIQNETWTKLSATGRSPSPRYHHTMTFDGKNRIFIWGGLDDKGHPIGDGAMLDLATMSWTSMPNIENQSRFFHTAVWANGRLVIYGGRTQDSRGDRSELADGTLVFDPGFGWKVVSKELSPFLVFHHTAIWTGESMLVWGGQSGFTSFEYIGAKFLLGR
jgi:hypothetical protein